VRFASRASSQVWTREDFAAWLRAREAWRDTHAEPLPSLPRRERCALQQMDLPRALVDAEKRAPQADPQVTRFGLPVDRGRLPVVVHPGQARGSYPSAVDQWSAGRLLRRACSLPSDSFASHAEEWAVPPLRPHATALGGRALVGARAHRCLARGPPNVWSADHGDALGNYLERLPFERTLRCAHYSPLKEWDG
jgi:hypothetical protein